MITKECPTCEGVGTVYIGDTRSKWRDRWVPDDDYQECGTCNGDKVVADLTCQVCKGAGSYPVAGVEMVCVHCGGNGEHRPDIEERLARARRQRYVELPTDAADKYRAERKDGGR